MLQALWVSCCQVVLKPAAYQDTELCREFGETSSTSLSGCTCFCWLALFCTIVENRHNVDVSIMHGCSSHAVLTVSGQHGQVLNTDHHVNRIIGTSDYMAASKGLLKIQSC